MNRFQYSTHRHLLLSLVARDVRARYRGSWLGLFWTLINPILLMLVYYFVFHFVFRVKLPQIYGDRDIPFAGFIFAGLIIYFLFSEVVTRAPNLVHDNANYVKKVVFPLEVIPLVSVLGATINLLISIIVLTVFLVFAGHEVSWSIIALPLVLIPYVCFLTGIAWFFSALGVYIRDVSYIAGFIATAMMFLSPVFYAVQSVPEAFGNWMWLNPLTYFIETFRYCLLGGIVPDAAMLWPPALIGLMTLIFGYVFFQRVRSGFADIL